MSDLPIPRGERGRMQAIERLGAFDAPADEFIDDAVVAAAAALIVNAPMAAVTVVDTDRLRIKSSRFIVTDLALDARCADNPFVVGKPRARFYAGFPLVVDGGFIGAVCMLDDPAALLVGGPDPAA